MERDFGGFPDVTAAPKCDTAATPFDHKLLIMQILTEGQELLTKRCRENYGNSLVFEKLSWRGHDGVET